MNPQDTDPLRDRDTDREPTRRAPYQGWADAGRHPAGTRVTWFVLGLCVGIVLAVVGMAGIAEAASRSESQPNGSGLPGSARTVLRDGASRVETLSGTPQGRSWGDGPRASSGSVNRAGERPASGVPLTPKRPTAALAGPLISGEATWCAPTPTHCQGWGNGRLLGAVHSFRWGDEPYRVRVWRGERSVTVRIVSYCACLNRSDTIDLSVAAAKAIEPDWRRLGRFAVELEDLRP